MMLRTLIINSAPGTKFVIYHVDDSLVWAGTKEQSYGEFMSMYGRFKVRHYGPCYNKDDGSYISVSLKG